MREERLPAHESNPGVARPNCRRAILGSRRTLAFNQQYAGNLQSRMPAGSLRESACILNARSEPVSIGAVEKFISEYAFAHEELDAAVTPPNGFKVAVVGSGPGGMACADELAKLGYAVTIFEAQTRPGGLLVNGIPSFKLEKKIVERRFDLLHRRGVAVRCGVTVGRDILLSSLRETFDAVYLAIGAQKPKWLDIPGAD